MNDFHLKWPISFGMAFFFFVASLLVRFVVVLGGEHTTHIILSTTRRRRYIRSCTGARSMLIHSPFFAGRTLHEMDIGALSAVRHNLTVGRCLNTVQMARHDIGGHRSVE